MPAAPASPGSSFIITTSRISPLRPAHFTQTPLRKSGSIIRHSVRASAPSWPPWTGRQKTALSPGTMCTRPWQSRTATRAATRIRVTSSISIGSQAANILCPASGAERTWANTSSTPMCMASASAAGRPTAAAAAEAEARPVLTPPRAWSIPPTARPSTAMRRSAAAVEIRSAPARKPTWTTTRTTSATGVPMR